MKTLVLFIYLLAAVGFILGIKRLGKANTARQGNFYSLGGMVLAVLAVFLDPRYYAVWHRPIYLNGFLWAVIAILIGSLIGAYLAMRVKMIAMPQMVALFNGFGGLSSMFLALAEAIRAGSAHTLGVETRLSTMLAILIGGVTFTGSMIAWAKLDGRMPTKAIFLPYHNWLNLAGLILAAVLTVVYTVPGTGVVLRSMSVALLACLALALGGTLVIGIGGGDMPVIISLLNAFSGLAASMAGFILGNTVLIVAGCLVGASGLILTIIMCKAMNKSLLRLLLTQGQQSSSQQTSEREPVAMSTEDAYLILEAARSVAIVPGYGMAVAQAQHVVKELAERLQQNGAEVNYVIHPVAGRMPGHMNVLLAEADVDYDQLRTMEEMNPSMGLQDVALVIGANDVVNPVAEKDPSSPIYGMPIIKAYEAKTVFVLKRGQGKGYSGVENELFTRENTLMLYGDAKATLSALVNEFSEA